MISRSFLKGLALCSACMVWHTTAHAQQAGVLWRVINQASGTVVPAYAGQPSPFPSLQVKPKVVSATDPALEQARQARMLALQSAEALLNSAQALKPNYRNVRVAAVISGPRGSRVLMSNRWVSVGQQLKVPLMQTAEAQEALNTLKQYDSVAAAELADRLDDRITASPSQLITLQAITSATVVFTSSYGQYIVPIQITKSKKTY
jgi:hypothetical protein